MTDRLESFMRYLKEGTTVHDFDYVIILDGPEGSGKSSLAMHAKMFYDGKYSLDNVIYDATDLIKIMYEAPRASFILHDEAVCDFMSRTALNKFQIRLVKAFSIAREMNHIYCLLIPNYNLLDPALKIRARYRFWVYARGFERGYLKVFYSKRNAFTKKRPFHDERWHYRFPMLPEKTLRAYKEFKTTELKKKLMQLQGETEKDRRMAEDEAKGIRGVKARLIKKAMKDHPSWKADEVAAEVGCSLKHARDTMKVIGAGRERNK